MHLAELVEKLFAETKLKVYFRGRLFLTISFFFIFTHSLHLSALRGPLFFNLFTQIFVNIRN